MKQGQETNQIWTQEAGTHDTHDRGLTLLPPPERRVPRRNSSTGEGGWAGALEAPQDKHGQEHRTGTSRAEQTTEAMAELGALEAMAELGALKAMAVQGAQEAMAGRLRGLSLGPLSPAPTAGTLSTPPKKNSWGS